MREDPCLSAVQEGGKFLSNIVCRIIIPTILFAAIEYVPNCVIRGNPISFNMAIYKTIGGGTYWFTSALAVSEIIILFLLISRKKSIWFYFIACILVGGLGMITQQGMYDKEIWAYHRGVIALIFIVSGGLFWNYEEIVTKYMKRYVVITMIAIYTAVLLFIHDNNPNISILSLQPWGIVTTLIGCVLLIEICKRLPENKALNYIGQNTLGFYFVCGAVPSVATPFFHSLTTGRYLCLMLVEWIVCLLIAYIIVRIIHQYFPWMFDIRQLKKK